jgi:tryptophan synthase alpha chain
MSRIAKTFERLRNERRGGFIPFITAGDPDIATSTRLAIDLADGLADIIELGVPFSDPMADGPTIQASSMRALTNGTDLNMIVDMVKEIRTNSDVPIVLFSYLNPLLRYGIERLADVARDAGIDGMLVVDAIEEDAATISSSLARRDVDLISLVAPTTSDERLRLIAANAEGFIYAVSRAGVTGTSSGTAGTAGELVRRTRAVTDLPIAVGFGISSREQVEEVWSYADAAVVGSAIVKEIERSIGRPDLVDVVGRFARSLVPEVAKPHGES